MRKQLTLACAAILLLAGLSAVLGQSAGETYAVPVDKLVIFKEPAPYFGSVGTAAQNEALAILEVKGKWLRVRSGAGVEGWILPPGSGGTVLRAASSTGVGLVTRGFAEGYARRNNADPAALDSLEQPKFSADELESFSREGGLNRAR